MILSPSTNRRSATWLDRAGVLLIALVTFALAALGLAPIASADGTNDLYNAAQRGFVTGDVDAGLGSIAALLAASPDDSEALALQAIFATYAGDLVKATESLVAVDRVDPDMGRRAHSVIDSVVRSSLTPPNPFPTLAGPGTGVVILGYGLLPDGSMRPELIDRLETGLVQAFAAPFSPVVVTGGNPQAGVTEAAAMSGWLRDRGIPDFRIHEENRAGSTVGNALYSTELLRSLGAVDAVLVTSANHIRRATADFMVAGMPIIGGSSPQDGIAEQVTPEPRQLSMYVDASRVAGISSGR